MGVANQAVEGDKEEDQGEAVVEVGGVAGE